MVLTAAQTLFAALECSVLKDMCSMFGYKSQLEELKDSVITIRAVLLDAEAKQDLEVLSHEAQIWIDKLKDAVYDVDDLLDGFNTLMSQQQLKEMSGNRSKFSRKVRRFFSRPAIAYFMSREIKEIRKKLNAVASDHKKFGFRVNYEPIMRTREETSSHVREDNIIGRDSDKEEIVGLFQESQVEENVSFVTIVGIGGLGKTALAQLVYNDDRIKVEFPLRLWVCVSEEFGVRQILSKMVTMAIGINCDDLLMDQLHTKVRDLIEGERYLLVLDDVWSENRNEWVDLRDFLMRGGRGSRILVTSRSKLVARAIGLNYPVYELQGLPREDSWCLFKQMAFERGQEPVDADRVEIGKDIVKKCANVPLSIRVIGSLLYGQDRSQWMSFKDNSSLPTIKVGKDDTLAILRFSYHHLTPSLKSCFGYCALFPKDYKIPKNTLISLWSAHGCIEPIHEGQSIEDAGEQYFSILLNRCFFQDIKKDYYGEIVSCKIHDLMHDLAQAVAGKECSMLPSTSQLDRKTRHLSIARRLPNFYSSSDGLQDMKKLRTFLQVKAFPRFKLVCQSMVAVILSNCRMVRVLDLSGMSIETLPSSIGNLVHLRYLDISSNDKIKALPRSVANLHNLQVLKLFNCRLRVLPEELSKLVNLRHLDIRGCNGFFHMPKGMKNLTLLHTLSDFIVVEGNDKQNKSSRLEDLKSLIKLKGKLRIKVREICAEDTSKVREGGYLLNKPHLKHVVAEFEDGVPEGVHEAVLDGLQPNRDLREISIEGYGGMKFPDWARSIRASVPNLVKIKLNNLPRVQYLPSLSLLHYLTDLLIENIPKVEYMEMIDRCSDAATSASASTLVNADLIFFPSLEQLCLGNLLGLKGWWSPRNYCSLQLGVDVKHTTATSIKGAGSKLDEVGEGVGLSFPRLHKLSIYNCPNMTSFPPCLHVEDLKLGECNEALTFREKRGVLETESTGECSSNLSLPMVTAKATKSSHTLFAGAGNLGPPILKKLSIDDVGFLSRLPTESVESLLELRIHGDSSVERLSTSTVGEVFRSCSSSLRSLDISLCHNLRRLGRGGIEHLTNLQLLTISKCDNLAFEEEDEHTWKFLETALISLKLDNLPKLVHLPKGIQYMTALQSLHISDCTNLIGLPESLHSLTSLRSLHIWNCPKVHSLPEAFRYLPSLAYLDICQCPSLTERCKSPTGEDWSKIRHIPTVTIIKSFHELIFGNKE